MEQDPLQEGDPKGLSCRLPGFPQPGAGGPPGGRPYAGPGVAGPFRKVSPQECKGPRFPWGCQRGLRVWAKRKGSSSTKLSAGIPGVCGTAGRVAEVPRPGCHRLGMMNGTPPHRPSPPAILSRWTQGGPFWTESCSYQQMPRCWGGDKMVKMTDFGARQIQGLTSRGF